MKRLLVIIFALHGLICRAQDDFDNYLQNHHHSFTSDSGFNESTAKLLKQKLSGYRLIISGEGGSHYLQFYEPLLFVWLQFLSDHFGMNHFFLETGHSSDILYNHYLQTGDTTHLPRPRSARTNAFLAAALSYNQLKPDGKKLVPLGIDFERPNSYLKALKLLMPKAGPPRDIADAVHLIKTSDTLYSCSQIVSINKTLRKALNNNREDFKNYLQEKFDDFEWIVLNNGSCLDTYKNRNGKMAENVLQFHAKLKDSLYFAQLGMAHTVLTSKTTASIINTSPEFKNQVCVINTYCHNCTTKEEPVSNWQLAKIEKEILDRLLKYCTTDFTLFDFTGNSPVIEKFRKYGQFLIIAKNQN